jgi:DNA polymerase-3 subunit gamma/tau
MLFHARLIFFASAGRADQGMLELDVTINEEIRAARPIKLEDRVKYMTEKNPLLAELRRALDLEVE